MILKNPETTRKQQTRTIYPSKIINKLENRKSKWEDWKWQIRHNIRDINEVEKLLAIKFDPELKEKLKKTIKKFPISITPYYLSLIERENYQEDPIFKQAVPDYRELYVSKYEMNDPLHEDVDSPASCITHRYPDRVLFLISNTCAMYCRHCTRKRKVGDIDLNPYDEEIFEGIQYIRDHHEIRDVLLSGGDPFLLSDTRIDWILKEISEIPHVEIIRIGTRTPVVLPFRITDNLLKILKKYPNIWINTHFNHPRELTKHSKLAIKKLVEIGIPIGNQTVLLRDVNDCIKIMKKLVQKLVANRIRPYYLYQCDLSEGLMHFRTNIGKGVEIIERLIGHTTGFSVPRFVIDAPGGGGKIPIMPNYLISWSDDRVILRNYEGVITTYRQPDVFKSNVCDLDCDNCKLTFDLEIDDEELENIPVGLERLLVDYDKTYSLSPKENIRMQRVDNEQSAVIKIHQKSKKPLVLLKNSKVLQDKIKKDV